MNKLAIKILFWIGLVWVAYFLVLVIREAFSTSPFTDYWMVYVIQFIPGIILLIIAGIGHLTTKT